MNEKVHIFLNSPQFEVETREKRHANLKFWKLRTFKKGIEMSVSTATIKYLANIQKGDWDECGYRNH